MARPVAADSQLTRQMVLNAAVKLFSAQGVDGVSIRDIARQSNVSLGVVYHYFGNKDGLYEACIDAMYEELGAMKEALQSGTVSGGTSDIIEHAVSVCFKFAVSHQGAIRLLMRDIVHHGEMQERRRSQYLLPFLSDGALLIAAATGVPLLRARLALQSMSHLVVRYALTTPRELALICASDEQSASTVIEEHLVETALRLLDLSENGE